MSRYDLQCLTCDAVIDGHRKCNSWCYFDPALVQQVHAVVLHSHSVGIIPVKGVEGIECATCGTVTMSIETLDFRETLEYDESKCDSGCVRHFVLFLWVIPPRVSYVHMG